MMIVTTMTTSTTALPSLARAALSASTSLSPAAPTGVCCLAMPRRGQLRSGGGHDDNDDHTGVNRTILVCAQCDVGYRLDAEDDFVLENGVVVGECECAAGWGVVYDPLINPKKYDDGIFTCVDCSTTGQVPLRKGSGVVQIWSNNAWVLAPAGTKGTRLPRRPPPKTYYEGQCVDCPTGYVPYTNSTACVRP